MLNSRTGGVLGVLSYGVTIIVAVYVTLVALLTPRR